MYTVVSYNNSRTNGSVKFIEVFSSCVKAIRCARKCANFKYGEDNVTDRISQRLIDVKDILIQFSSSDCLDRDVFAVVSLPSIKEEEEEDNTSVCSCDEIVLNQESVSLFHKNACRRRSSVDRKLFIHHDTYVNTKTKEHFHVYISGEDDTENESNTESDTENDTENESNTESNTEMENDMDFDFDDRYDDDVYYRYYDERDDDDRYYYDGGYEDECFECLDL